MTDDTRIAALEALLSDAWGIIANAENFKSELICEHAHCQDPDKHDYTTWQTQPVGDESWRQAANAWRDRWHATTGASRDA